MGLHWYSTEIFEYLSSCKAENTVSTKTCLCHVNGDQVRKSSYYLSHVDFDPSSCLTSERHCSVLFDRRSVTCSCDGWRWNKPGTVTSSLLSLAIFPRHSPLCNNREKCYKNNWWKRLVKVECVCVSVHEQYGAWQKTCHEKWNHIWWCEHVCCCVR